MIRIIPGGNCWTMGIGKVDVLKVFRLYIDLVHPREWLRIYREGRTQPPLYTRDAWKAVFRTITTYKNRAYTKEELEQI